MPNPSTFNALLEQLAARHRQDIQSLSDENIELRQRIAELQDLLEAECGLDVRGTLPPKPRCEATFRQASKDTKVSRVSVASIRQSSKNSRATITSNGRVAREARANALADAVTEHHRDADGYKSGLMIVTTAVSTTANTSEPDRSEGSPEENRCVDWAPQRAGSKLSAGFTSQASIRAGVQMEKKLDKLSQNEIKKLHMRLKTVLCSSAPAATGGHESRGSKVVPRKLFEILQSRADGQHYTLESVTALLAELADVAERCWPKELDDQEPASEGISLSDFAKILLVEDIDLFVPDNTAKEVARLNQILVTEDTDEVIARLSSSNVASLWRQVFNVHATEERTLPANVAACLNAVVATVVFVSLVLLGVSLDYAPDSVVWTVFESVFAVIFVAECVIKVYYLGCRTYLFGRDCAFNWLDVCITIVTAIDLFMTVDSDGSSFNVTTILKGLRLCRLLRLMKLLNNSPVLKQLASMLSGLWIGVPSLLWVNVLLILLIYIVAIVFRSVFIAKSAYSRFTPAELIARCGKGDYVQRNEFDLPVDPECKLHLIYGEEFLGSVPRAMITIFRFITGDTATAGGRSLTEYLDTTDDQAVSWPTGAFYFFYIPFMIIVWFGMFNIITAIFVETTITGLKHNDAQNKRRRLYESRYVQRKLTELVKRIDAMSTQGSFGRAFDDEPASEMQLDEQSFVQLMGDSEVRSLLLDLDVIMDETACTFEMFDPEGIGTITVAEFLSTLLRLRGEPQKIDLVSSWSSLRMLQKSFQDFQQVVIANLRQVAVDQQLLASKVDDLAGNVE